MLSVDTSHKGPGHDLEKERSRPGDATEHAFSRFLETQQIGLDALFADTGFVFERAVRTHHPFAAIADLFSTYNTLFGLDYRGVRRRCYSGRFGHYSDIIGLGDVDCDTWHRYVQVPLTAFQKEGMTQVFGRR